MLTDNEQIFLTALKGIDHDSAWGLAISEVIKDPQPAIVRRLIVQLKDQAKDDTGIMLSIIGEPGLRQLQAM